MAHEQVDADAERCRHLGQSGQTRNEATGHGVVSLAVVFALVTFLRLFSTRQSLFPYFWFLQLLWQRRQASLKLMNIVLTNTQRGSCHRAPSSATALRFQFTPESSTKSVSHLLIGTFVPCLYFLVASQLRFLKPSSACVPDLCKPEAA